MEGKEAKGYIGRLLYPFSSTAKKPQKGTLVDLTNYSRSACGIIRHPRSFANPKHSIVLCLCS